MIETQDSGRHANLFSVARPASRSVCTSDGAAGPRHAASLWAEPEACTLVPHPTLPHFQARSSGVLWLVVSGRGVFEASVSCQPLSACSPTCGEFPPQAAPSHHNHRRRYHLPPIPFLAHTRTGRVSRAVALTTRPVEPTTRPPLHVLSHCLFPSCPTFHCLPPPFFRPPVLLWPPALPPLPRWSSTATSGRTAPATMQGTSALVARPAAVAL